MTVYHGLQNKAIPSAEQLVAPRIKRKRLGPGPGSGRRALFEESGRGSGQDRRWNALFGPCLSLGGTGARYKKKRVRQAGMRTGTTGGIEDKMSASVTNELGKISYEGNTVDLLARQAASECYGLTGLANQGGATSGITNFFTGKSAGRGVEVTEDGSNKIRIKLYVTAKYGVSLPTVAENVIEKVKYTIENETGLTVETIDVVVQSIEV